MAARPCRSRAARRSALLARLLLDVNRTVSVDAIIDSLWGEDVPASAVKMVHVYVSQLRKVLPDGVLRTRAPGYVLEVAPEAVDLAQFTRLRTEGRAALTEGRPRDRFGAAAGRPGPLAGRGAGRVLRAVRGRPGRAPRGAARRLHRGPHRSRPRARPSRRPRRRAARPRGRPPAARAAALPADARALSRRAARPRRWRSTTSSARRCSDELAMEPSSRADRSAAQDPQSGRVARPRRRHGPAGVERGAAAPRPPMTTPSPSSAAPPSCAASSLRLEAATAGRGTTALLTGPAGIGKTRLVEQLARRARANGATVLSGRCIDLVGAGLPYLPLIEALRPLCGSPWLDGLRGELRELPRLHPDLHPDFAGGAAPPGHGDPAESRARLFAEVLAILEHLSHGAPVVLALEDLHWADGSTLDLFAYLAHAVRRAPRPRRGDLSQRRAAPRARGPPPRRRAATRRDRRSWSRSARCTTRTSKRCSRRASTSRCPPS